MGEVYLSFAAAKEITMNRQTKKKWVEVPKIDK